MRVAYDETGLELDATGSARAARDLRDALEARDDVELVPVAQPPGRGGRVARGLERELTWFPFGLPRRGAALRADVLHCPMPLAPPRRASTADAWSTVNDAHRVGPPGVAHPRARRSTPGSCWRPPLRRAAGVLVPSEHTRERLLASVRGLGAGARRASRRTASTRASRPGRRRRSATPYLLAVGTLQPRKNLEAALRAFERLRRGSSTGSSSSGARGWRDDALLARAAPLAGAPSGSTLLGRVDRRRAASTLYRGAACLLYPSRARGLRLPAAGGDGVRDARWSAAAAGSLPEVLGRRRAARRSRRRRRRSPPPSTRVLADPEPLARSAGSRAPRAFSWARCAELTVAAYARERARMQPRRPRRSRALSTWLAATATRWPSPWRRACSACSRNCVRKPDIDSEPSTIRKLDR